MQKIDHFLIGSIKKISYLKIVKINLQILKKVSSQYILPEKSRYIISS